MRILFALTYYRPYTSGLTIYVERLAAAMARRGHSVTVLTSQYDPSLPRHELMDGVRVVRAPVAARVSKGVIMPAFGLLANILSLQSDAMSLHLPQFDAPGLALRGRLLRQPVVLTYHSDLQLPPGLMNRVANRVVDSANLTAGALSTRIVAYTQDFADHSPFLRRFREKIVVIPPPVEVAPASAEQIAGFRERWNIRGPIIGMAARLAAEKGVEVLLNALPRILEAHPTARVLFAGPYENVLGEESYARHLAPLFERFRDHWTFLGTLGPTGHGHLLPQPRPDRRALAQLHRDLRARAGRGDALRHALDRQRPARRPPARAPDGHGPGGADRRQRRPRQLHPRHPRRPRPLRAPAGRGGHEVQHREDGDRVRAPV